MLFDDLDEEPWKDVEVFARPFPRACPTPGGTDSDEWKVGLDGMALVDESKVRFDDVDGRETLRFSVLSSGRWPSSPRAVVLCSSCFSSSSDSDGGISSTAGSGLPLATVVSWYSVHESEWSLRPLQKGASRRPIWSLGGNGQYSQVSSGRRGK